MRVNNQHIIGVQKAYNLQKKLDEIKRSEQQQKDDDIKLSSEAKLWSAAMQAARSLPDSGAQKIEELKAAIKNGTYQVSDEEVADKIWQEALRDKD